VDYTSSGTSRERRGIKAKVTDAQKVNFGNVNAYLTDHLRLYILAFAVERRMPEVGRIYTFSHRHAGIISNILVITMRYVGP
jgi:hypothetical protein